MFLLKTLQLGNKYIIMACMLYVTTIYNKVVQIIFFFFIMLLLKILQQGNKYGIVYIPWLKTLSR